MKKKNSQKVKNKIYPKKLKYQKKKNLKHKQKKKMNNKNKKIQKNKMKILILIYRKKHKKVLIRNKKIHILNLKQTKCFNKVNLYHKKKKKVLWKKTLNYFWEY